MAKTVFHALTYNSDVPSTETQQKSAKNQDRNILRYQRYRKEHDPAWEEATQHPLSLYRFLGLNDEEMLKIFGEPPRAEKPALEKEGTLLTGFLERLEQRMGDAG